MKTQFLIPICCSLIFIGCSESDESTISGSFPDSFYLHFNLEVLNRTVIEDGSVTIAEVPVNSYGEPIYSSTVNYVSLGKIESISNVYDLELFGVPCEGSQCMGESYVAVQFMTGWEELNVEMPDNLEVNRYFLLMFSEDNIDTLRYKYIINPDLEYTYEFSLNSEFLELLGDYPNYHIKIEKEDL